MADKWSKKICIEHITQLKSPFDEAGSPPANTNPDIQRLVEAGRRYQSEVSQKRGQGEPQ